MKNISIKEINEFNNGAVKEVKVKNGQETFIETVEECLAEAAEYKEWCPVAIYADNTLVGFAMYGSFGPNKHTWIDRIIIDEKYQGKGYGRAAMIKLIDIVTKKYDVVDVYLSFVDGNEAAYNLYKSLGFKYINERDENGEYIFKYTKRKSS